MVSPRGALLFVAKRSASDETEDEDSMEHSGNPLAMFAEEDSLDDSAAVVNDGCERER